MTEAEWLKETTCSQWMMGTLREGKLPRTKAGRRKLRLFACGCCRLAWDRPPDARLGGAVEAAERFADGLASEDELHAARASVAWMREDSAKPGGTPLHARVAIDMAVATTEGRAYEAAFYMTATSQPLAGCRGEQQAGEAALCHLIRCVFGNPFRPVALAPAWLSWNGGLLDSIARRMYDSRDFSDMPVLADALEEAGCKDPDILCHCRSGGEHVRGCWVVDLLLGKT